MFSALQRIFAIQELKKKIIFTSCVLVACRLGSYIPVPGIDGDVALSVFRYATGGGQNLFQLIDIFSGGAFSKMTVVALGVMPYITASIIMQVLIMLIPSLQREIRESPDQGKRKLSKWTRLSTLALCIFQSILFAQYALKINRATPGIILSDLLQVEMGGVPWLFYLTVILTMSAGTLLLMWLGEQISEKGIGNGISLIIAVGILSSLPGTLGSIIQQLNLGSQEPGQLTFASLVILFALFVLISVGTILVIQGQRKISLQHARRIVGRHEVQGGSSHIPLKINYAGVIPVIFANSFLMFPATLGQFTGKGTWLGELSSYLSPGSWTYTMIYFSLIILFTFFWTAAQFRPEQIASDMKKNGAFIPGVRQGRPTQEFLQETMGRITFMGALFLALIAILPTLVGKVIGVDSSISQFFGGTSLLILVGVILDTSKQIESHLLMKRYDGFMSRGRLRGR